MPLSKKRDKARKRLERARDVVQPNSNLNVVQPVVSIPGLKMEGNKITGVQPKGIFGGYIGDDDSIKQPNDKPKPPFYDRRIHKMGDLVRMRTGSGKVIEVTVPELDEEGQPMYDN